jgi:hypothetical protein
MAGKIQDQVQQASSIQRNQVLEDFRWAITSRHASSLAFLAMEKSLLK